MIQKDINGNSVDRYENMNIRVYKFYSSAGSINLINRITIKESFNLRKMKDLLFVSIRDPLPFFSRTNHKQQTFIKPYYYAK